MSINIPGFTPDLRSAQPSGLPSADRIAAALERIADALERAHAAYMDIEASNQPAKPCEDRTCTDCDHWAVGRINHGDTPTTCTHGQDHPDTLACEYACAATMPGHRCTCAEHSDDRHQWVMTDEEYDRRREEAGVPRDVFDDVRAWADGREAAQRRLTAGCSDRGGECGQLDGSGAAGLNLNVQTALAEIMTTIETGCDMVTASLGLASNPQKTADAMRAAVAMLRETVMRYTGPTVTVDARSLETGEPVPVSVTVRKVADPLGEWRTGVHIAEGMTVRIIGADGSTRVGTVGRVTEADGLTNWALIPDEADPLDEDDHRPRHERRGQHLYRWGAGHWHSKRSDERPDWCNAGHGGDTLADWARARGPLTFCDCDAATIEAENGATG